VAAVLLIGIVAHPSGGSADSGSALHDRRRTPTTQDQPPLRSTSIEITNGPINPVPSVRTAGAGKAGTGHTIESDP